MVHSAAFALDREKSHSSAHVFSVHRAGVGSTISQKQVKLTLSSIYFGSWEFGAGNDMYNSTLCDSLGLKEQKQRVQVNVEQYCWHDL